MDQQKNNLDEAKVQACRDLHVALMENERKFINTPENWVYRMVLEERQHYENIIGELRQQSAELHQNHKLDAEITIIRLASECRTNETNVKSKAGKVVDEYTVTVNKANNILRDGLESARNAYSETFETRGNYFYRDIITTPLSKITASVRKQYVEQINQLDDLDESKVDEILAAAKETAKLAYEQHSINAQQYLNNKKARDLNDLTASKQQVASLIAQANEKLGVAKNILNNTLQVRKPVESKPNPLMQGIFSAFIQSTFGSYRADSINQPKQGSINSKSAMNVLGIDPNDLSKLNEYQVWEAASNEANKALADAAKELRISPNQMDFNNPEHKKIVNRILKERRIEESRDVIINLIRQNNSK